MTLHQNSKVNRRFEILNQFNTLVKLSQQFPQVQSDSATVPRGVTANMREMSDALTELARKVNRLLDERDGLVTLAEIEKQIASSLNTQEILELVLDAIIRLTSAEHCFLLLVDGDGQGKIEAGRNWQQKNLSEEETALSSSIVQYVIETGDPVLTTNAQEDPRFGEEKSVMLHALRSIMCVPLINQAGIIGAIYADHRNFSNRFSASNLEVLTRFANQAAIALRNASLFEELEEAYYSTLIGWAKALELRDKDTEGHTQRVTALTVRLAEEMGLEGEDLVNIQRGAILHDIGKMAIPDDILLKEGELTEEEREVINQHPDLAMEMISQISFLADARDIPCCHHEKWDGSGYPKGLKGEEIPLAARLFGVVDVWDAMTSDQPYRPAIPQEEVLAFIRSQSGIHFDPAVVEKFCSLVEAGTLTEKANQEQP